MAKSQNTPGASPDVQLVTLRQSAMAEIRRRIASGEIPPGTSFSEATMSEDLGMSRAPVREALIVLNQLGWVTSQPRSGYLVAPMTLSDLRELFTLRALLEPKAAELAAKNQSRVPEQTLELSRFITDFDDPARPEWIDDHYRFHRRVAVLGHNRELDRVLSEVHLKLERYFSIEPVRQALQDEVLEHATITDAILRAAPKEAAAAAAAHVAAAQLVLTEAILSSDGILSMPLTLPGTALGSLAVDDGVA